MSKSKVKFSANQRAKIRQDEGSDLALARKYGVTAEDIHGVRGSTKKRAPAKKKAKKAAPRKKAAKPTQPQWLTVLGGPELPQPLR